MRVWTWAGLMTMALAQGAAAGEFVLRAQEIDDRKAVIATVEPVRQLVPAPASAARSPS